MCSALPFDPANAVHEVCQQLFRVGETVRVEPKSLDVAFWPTYASAASAPQWSAESSALEPSTMPLPYLLLGNPENRRVALFQEALALEGLPPARVVSWRDFLTDARALASLPDEPMLLRVDSPGEDEAVERALLHRGYDDARHLGCHAITPSDLDALAPSFGQILCPRQAHLGFERALGQLEEVLSAHPRWRCLNPPSDIQELFDKRLTSRRYSALGVPVPEPLHDVTDVDSLFAAMSARGWRSAFVKLSSGSSASCLAVVHHRPTGPSLHTTIEETRDGAFNTLKVRHVRDPGHARRLLEFLLAEGSQVERSVPKARLDGAFFDLRVLCIGGEPRFMVVRQNRHPITNLHLGGWRGDLEGLRRLVPPASWDAAMQSCRTVAQSYRSLHLGIDLMFEPGLEAHRVIEANAFGDLLPRLTLDGASVWQWEIRQAQASSG